MGGSLVSPRPAVEAPLPSELQILLKHLDSDRMSVIKAVQAQGLVNSYRYIRKQEAKQYNAAEAPDWKLTAYGLQSWLAQKCHIFAHSLFFLAALDLAGVRNQYDLTLVDFCCFVQRMCLCDPDDIVLCLFMALSHASEPRFIDLRTLQPIPSGYHDTAQGDANPRPLKFSMSKMPELFASGTVARNMLLGQHDYQVNFEEYKACIRECEDGGGAIFQTVHHLRGEFSGEEYWMTARNSDLLHNPQKLASFGSVASYLKSVGFEGRLAIGPAIATVGVVKDGAVVSNEGTSAAPVTVNETGQHDGTSTDPLSPPTDLAPTTNNTGDGVSVVHVSPGPRFSKLSVPSRSVVVRFPSKPFISDYNNSSGQSGLPSPDATHGLHHRKPDSNLESGPESDIEELRCVDVVQPTQTQDTFGMRGIHSPHIPRHLHSGNRIHVSGSRWLDEDRFSTSSGHGDRSETAAHQSGDGTIQPFRQSFDWRLYAGGTRA